MHVDGALLDAEGRIDPARWTAALAGEDVVGECHCGQPALPGPVDVDFFGRRFYTVLCLIDPDHEAVVPAGRTVRATTMAPLVGLGLADGVLDAARERDAAILGERVA